MSATIDPGDPGSFLHPKRSRRGASFALALAIEFALLLLVWFSPNFRELVKHPSRVLKTFDFKMPRAGGAPKAPTSGKKQVQVHSVEPPLPPPVLPPPVAVPKPPPNPLAMSSSDYAATDISKLGSGKGGSSSGKGTAYGPPDGMGSEYALADWYRRPPDGVLRPYLTKDTPTGWGLIVCQVVEHYHVDNCRALTESPAGSGLARAMRQASYQFLVKPPTENGRPMIGAWVRIRFDLLPAGSGEDN